MRALIACEFSGIVREAFRTRGHDAWSCDLLPTEIPGNHICGDVLEVLEDNWDLVIAHPPCTDLSVSGARYWEEKRKDGRQDAAIEFFMKFARCRAEKVAIENPVGIISSVWRKPDQIVQPWWFGDDASKKTCLWLKGLPLLVGTNILPGGSKVRRANQTASGQNRVGPSPDRWKERSRTYPGLAAAMAEQWG